MSAEANCAAPDIEESASSLANRLAVALDAGENSEDPAEVFRPSLGEDEARGLVLLAGETFEFAAAIVSELQPGRSAF